MEEVLNSLNELKEIVLSKKEAVATSDNIRWMDTAELMEYLHICRRTTLTFRQKGLPCSQIDGKIFYRKDLVDKFLQKHEVKQKGK